MIVCVAVLIILVQLIQWTGERISKALNRK